MPVKPPNNNKVNLEDERVRRFLREGSPVLEDVIEEEKKIQEKKKREEEEWTMISMRIPVKLLNEMDADAKASYMNRSAWMMESFKDKLKGNRNV